MKLILRTVRTEQSYKEQKKNEQFSLNGHFNKYFFAVHIKRGENGWCEMLVNLSISRVILCYSKLVYNYQSLVKYSVFVINLIPSMIRIS